MDDSCPPTTFNRSFMLVIQPAQLIASGKPVTRILDSQVDGVDLTVQRHIGASRHAALDDVLQGFLQNPLEAQGNFRWKRLRDVFEVNVNRHTVSIGHFFDITETPLLPAP